MSDVVESERNIEISISLTSRIDVLRIRLDLDILRFHSLHCTFFERPDRVKVKRDEMS